MLARCPNDTGDRMESGFERELSRAATIRRRALRLPMSRSPAQKTDTDMAARRLAAWCRAAGERGLGVVRRSARLGTAGRSIRFWPDSPTVRATHGSPRRIGCRDAEWVRYALHAAGDPDVEHGHPRGVRRPSHAPRSRRRLPVLVGRRSESTRDLTDGAQTDLSATAVDRAVRLRVPALFERFVARERRRLIEISSRT